ncbi:MAG: hypothetical protein WC310_02230 [Patescibacteria group bacterium]|jgi:hypothetical protein
MENDCPYQFHEFSVGDRVVLTDNILLQMQREKNGGVTISGPGLYEENIPFELASPDNIYTVSAVKKETRGVWESTFQLCEETLEFYDFLLIEVEGYPGRFFMSYFFKTARKTSSISRLLRVVRRSGR